MIEIGSALDPGRRRKAIQNQDALCVIWPGQRDNKVRPPLLVVADGMGGYEGGAVASQAVVAGLAHEHLNAPDGETPLRTLQNGVAAALRRLKYLAAERPNLARMGSTVVAAVCETAAVHLLNVGDSRAYLINRRRVRQISYDHSLAADQIRQGLAESADARQHPRRNVLSMAISAQREQVEPFCGVFDWEAGDILLLCSDGLWVPVTEPEIQAVVLNYPPSQAAERLVALANANQGPDNISVIVARNG